MNLYEEESESFFNSGWRSTLGWLSVVIIFFTFLVVPGFTLYYSIHDPKIEISETDTNALMNLVGIIFGVGAMRTYEKVKKENTQAEERRRQYDRDNL